MPYALFKDGKQISKTHSTKEAALVEAFEARAIVKGAWDFHPKDGFDNTLCAGYEIRVVK